MAATGLLRLDIAGYGGLTVTDGGRDLLRGEGAFHYRPDSVATPAAVHHPADEPRTQQVQLRLRHRALQPICSTARYVGQHT